MRPGKISSSFGLFIFFLRIGTEFKFPTSCGVIPSRDTLQSHVDVCGRLRAPRKNDRTHRVGPRLYLGAFSSPVLSRLVKEGEFRGSHCVNEPVVTEVTCTCFCKRGQARVGWGHLVGSLLSWSPETVQGPWAILEAHRLCRQRAGKTSLSQRVTLPSLGYSSHPPN